MATKTAGASHFMLVLLCDLVQVSKHGTQNVWKIGTLHKSARAEAFGHRTAYCGPMVNYSSRHLQ